MPLFNYSQCNCIENTATGAYWGRKMRDHPALCSECDTETWHGQFAKKSAVGMLVTNDGFLWGRAESVPRHMRVVGTIDEHGGVAPRYRLRKRPSNELLLLA